MPRPTPEEVRRAGKAALLGTVLGLVLLILARRADRAARSSSPLDSA